MKWILMALFLVVLQFWTHEQVLNLEMETVVYHRIVNAMFLASQDAVEDVVASSTANGQPIFNQTEAAQTFQTTLANNLGLDPNTLQPVPNSTFHVAPRIVDEEFYDWSDTTFPYHYVNSAYGINETLDVPSMVAVVQFTMPSYAANVQPFTITVPMVQSYAGS
ncbi:hypothetical protein URH17368_0012 [Alicyclobacillus hesperidum URH17-3-68]|uniref:hypothetical protein n=1 Tax=Alicyclobacillus hesperidum TaxID=89784 RepID=UPI000281B257|nr:hypothetical protein [Alicyclobacillus hesperidum]EJY57289.1 hypothetical protein URH17368_0012 [Alicyclobacillus hesperidum URH17-3-68]